MNGKRANGSGSVLRLTTMGLLGALAIILGLFKFPIIPAAPWLEFDFADVPVLIGTLLFGPIPGLSILLVVSAMQAFLLGGNGIIGMFMHFFASGVLLLVFSAVYRGKKGVWRSILSVVAGALCMAAVMIPLNYVFTPMLFGVPREFVTEMLLPALIPFNLIKGGASCLFTIVLFRVLSPFFEKHGIERHYK